MHKQLKQAMKKPTPSRGEICCHQQVCKNFASCAIFSLQNMRTIKEDPTVPISVHLTLLDALKSPGFNLSQERSVIHLFRFSINQVFNTCSKSDRIDTSITINTSSTSNTRFARFTRNTRATRNTQVRQVMQETQVIT